MFRLLMAVAVLALALIPAAASEDGAPPEPLYTCDKVVNLDGGENYGGSGVRDCVNGGGGDNAIAVYGGRDRVDGRGGSDSIYGGDAQDTIWGGKEGDPLFGEGGDDYIYAGCPGGCDQSVHNYRNVLKGGEGNDYLAARNNEVDTLVGGPGQDTCYVDRIDDVTSCEDVRRG